MDEGFPCDGASRAETVFVLDISEDISAKLDVDMEMYHDDDGGCFWKEIRGLDNTNGKKYHHFSFSGKVQDAQLLIQTPMPEGICITSGSYTPPDSVTITSTVADLDGALSGKLRQDCDIT